MAEKQSVLAQRITNASAGFTASQKNIARYFLTNESSALLNTAASIAEKIGVSESTIVRFAHAIGFESYTQMQKELQQQYINRVSFSNRQKRQQVSNEGDTFYESIIRREITSLDHLINSDFFIRLDQASILIENAKQIFVAGSRGSAAIAHHLAYNLNYIKSPIISLVFDSSDWQDRMLDCTENDLVIGVCMPYYTQRTLDIMQFGKNCKATVLGITDSELSPACEVSDVLLSCNSSFMWSPATSIVVINALLQRVAQSNHPEITARLQKMDQVLNCKNPFAQ